MSFKPFDLTGIHSILFSPSDTAVEGGEEEKEEGEEEEKEEQKEEVTIVAAPVTETTVTEENTTTVGSGLGTTFITGSEEERTTHVGGLLGEDKWAWIDTENSLYFFESSIKDGNFEWPSTDWLTAHGGNWDSLQTLDLPAPATLDFNKAPFSCSPSNPKQIGCIRFRYNGAQADRMPTIIANDSIRINKIVNQNGLTINGGVDSNIYFENNFRGTLTLKNCNYKDFDFTLMQPDAKVCIDRETFENFNSDAQKRFLALAQQDSKHFQISEGGPIPSPNVTYNQDPKTTQISGRVGVGRT